MAAALSELADNAALRGSIGAANRAKASAEFDEAAMVSAYREVYGRAIGRDLPG